MDASLKVDGSFNERRARIINSYAARKAKNGGILYWMSRDQRVHDNWALYYAQQLSLKYGVPLIVCFCLVPRFLEATVRQYGFLLKGLQEVERELKRFRIPFSVELGNAKARIPKLVKDIDLSVVVCDFSPLRVPLSWVNETGKELDKVHVPLVQVDAHNVVPCWVVSNKAEYSARCIRAKIHNHLPEFLTDIPPITDHESLNKDIPLKDVNWSIADNSLKIDRTVKEVGWAEPGYTAGMKMLEDFCKKRLKTYSTQRNDPNKDSLSNLSPWYHFGHLSVQRAILEVKKYSKQHSKSVEDYIEEALVRKELADNFCFYNEEYDSLSGASEWAQETLELHSSDKREYLYTQEELEHAKTHDTLWNASQLQMMKEGKMHGYLRMYWAKKILEWTPSPEEALRISIYLNDKYELDGRDPNGYVGCMWSICGIHDQGWAERAVFGKIRYMNYAGCKRKFDVAQFERRYLGKRKKGPLDAMLQQEEQGESSSSSTAPATKKAKKANETPSPPVSKKVKKEKK